MQHIRTVVTFSTLSVSIKYLKRTTMTFKPCTVCDNYGRWIAFPCGHMGCNSICMNYLIASDCEQCNYSTDEPVVENQNNILIASLDDKPTSTITTTAASSVTDIVQPDTPDPPPGPKKPDGYSYRGTEFEDMTIFQLGMLEDSYYDSNNAATSSGAIEESNESRAAIEEWVSYKREIEKIDRARKTAEYELCRANERVKRFGCAVSDDLTLLSVDEKNKVCDRIERVIKSDICCGYKGCHYTVATPIVYFEHENGIWTRGVNILYPHCYIHTYECVCKDIRVKAMTADGCITTDMHDNIKLCRKCTSKRRGSHLVFEFTQYASYIKTPIGDTCLVCDNQRCRTGTTMEEDDVIEDIFDNVDMRAVDNGTHMCDGHACVYVKYADNTYMQCQYNMAKDYPLCIECAKIHCIDEMQNYRQISEWSRDTQKVINLGYVGKCAHCNPTDDNIWLREDSDTDLNDPDAVDWDKFKFEIMGPYSSLKSAREVFIV